MKYFNIPQKRMFLGAGMILSIGLLAIFLFNIGNDISAEENMPTQEVTLDLPKESLVAPAEGSVMSYFGPRTIMNKESIHWGIDIASADKDAVYAVTDGTVTKVFAECTANGHLGSSCGNGYGNYIQVEHNVNGQQFETLYAHLSEVKAQAGDKVTKNQKIGKVGSSGSAAGKSLHFEMHVPKKNAEKNAVDPLLYIPME